jgi:DNA polymerase I
MSKFEDILNNITPDEKHPNDRVLLIDGLNIFLRAFAVNGSLNEKGVPVGGITGFMRSLAFAIREMEPTRVIVVYDGAGGSKRRKKINPNYKSNRTPKRVTKFDAFNSLEEEKESMKIQFRRLLTYLELLPIDVYGVDNVEADDVIAYISQNILEKEVIIMSADQDFLQLVNDRIVVWSPNKKKYYTKEQIFTEYGIPAHNFLMYKCLMGDKSDNLEGIKGLGPKKIRKVIPEITGKELNLDYLVHYASTQDTLMHQRIVEHKVDLETNEKMMSLKDPLISGQIKMQIIDLTSRPTDLLHRNDFIRLYNEDYMGNNLKNPDIWLTDHFLKLNKLAQITHE